MGKKLFFLILILIILIPLILVGYLKFSVTRERTKPDNRYYYCVGILNRDASFCNEIINDTTMKESCYSLISVVRAREENSLTLCNQFEDGSISKLLCVGGIHVDFDLCENYPSPNECKFILGAIFDQVSEQELVDVMGENFSLSNFYFFKAWIRDNSNLCEKVHMQREPGDASDQNQVICKAMFGKNVCGKTRELLIEE